MHPICIIKMIEQEKIHYIYILLSILEYERFDGDVTVFFIPIFVPRSRSSMIELMIFIMIAKVLGTNQI